DRLARGGRAHARRFDRRRLARPFARPLGLRVGLGQRPDREPDRDPERRPERGSGVLSIGRADRSRGRRERPRRPRQEPRARRLPAACRRGGPERGGPRAPALLDGAHRLSKRARHRTHGACDLRQPEIDRGRRDDGPRPTLQSARRRLVGLGIDRNGHRRAQRNREMTTLTESKDDELARILAADSSTGILRRGVRWAIAAVAIVLVLGATLYYLRSRREAAKPRYETTAVTRGDLTVTVSATGNLAPTNQVDVGSEL